MSEQRFADGPEEPGDPLEQQEADQPDDEQVAKKPVDGEPWAKTSAGDDAD
jgi:hypothetical protein